MMATGSLSSVATYSRQTAFHQYQTDDTDADRRPSLPATPLPGCGVPAMFLLPMPYRFIPWQPARPDARAWTSDQQHAFVAALARCGVVARAAASVGMSATSAYRLRARRGAEGFAAAWDRAIDEGQARAIDVAMAQLDPVPQPMFRGGRRVGSCVRPDNRVLLAALNALDRRAARRAPAGPVDPLDPHGFHALVAAIRRGGEAQQ